MFEMQMNFIEIKMNETVWLILISLKMDFFFLNFDLRKEFQLTWMHRRAVFSVSTMMASIYLPKTFVTATL